MATKKRPVRDFLWRHIAAIAFVVMILFVGVIGFFGYTYVRVSRKFDSARKWDLPSRIYSDATPIVPGLRYSRDLLEPKLNHLGYHEVTGEVRSPGEYRYVDGNLEVFLQNFDYPDMDFRGVPVSIEMNGGVVKKIRRIDDGVSLRGIRFEPELITSIFNDEMEDRVPVALKNVPKDVVNAIIATEDKNFYHHEGISIRGTIGALITDLRQKTMTHGGSTLTQQLVKNLYLNPQRSLRRKIEEAIMAVMLEARYSKNDILEAYLNEIYLGQNGAVQIVGVEQASMVYFGKHVSSLTLPEAATIAGIIRSPNALGPIKYPDRAKARRDTVLSLMHDQKMITDQQFAEAVATPMSTSKFPRQFNSAPFFVDLVLKQLRDTYPETQLRTEGLRIFTTLDTMMQRSAEDSLIRGIASLKKKYPSLKKPASPLEGVVLTIQPGTGYVKALVGGTSYRKSQFNRAFQARRQPGSLFKPFVYVTAMDPARHQEALTASTVLDDSPISIRSGNSDWTPENYDGRFHGPVTVRRALAFSYNIPAVRAAMNAGVGNVVKVASEIGVQSRLEPYPSIALGSFEVTPLEIAYAYSVLANEGVKAEPISILAVATSDGKLLESREVKMKRVAPASVCYVMNNILKDVLDYGTAGHIRDLGFDRPFSGKTGTTNNYRDTWFVGYSPRVLTLVWVGFDDGTSTRLTGAEASMPIWAAHMTRIVGMVPDVDFKRPDDVVEREIDPQSGQLATPYCPETRTEVYAAGTEPLQLCALHGGGGEGFPFPFLRGDQNLPTPGIAEEARRAEMERRAEQARKHQDRSLRRILRWIFQ